MSARLSPRINVRPMRRADIVRLLPIEQAAYHFPWSARVFHDCLRVGYRGWCAADATDAVVGYGLLSIAAGESHVLNLCVAAAERGHGVGAQLLDVMAERAIMDHAQVMLLEVRPSNRSARRLYKRYGFEQVGRRPGYYPADNNREDALVLSLSLV